MANRSPGQKNAGGKSVSGEVAGDAEFDAAGGGGGEGPAFPGEAGEEALVVARQQHRAGGRGQGVLQAQDAGKVEVVGRFVHHDQVRPAGDAQREEELPHFAGRGLRGFEQAPGARSEARKTGHGFAERGVGEALGAGEDARGFRGGDFLRHEDEVLFRHVETRGQRAEERRFARAVGARQGDAVGGADFERGVGEDASGTDGQFPGGHAEEGVAVRDAGVVEPEARRVFLADVEGGASGLRLRRAAGEGGGLLAGPGVLAGQLGELAGGLAVVVVHVALGVFRRGLAAGGHAFAFFAAFLGGGAEAGGGAFRGVVLRAGGDLLAAVLLHALRHAAGAEGRGRGRDEEAFRAEFVEEGAVVAHEEPRAVVAAERREEDVAGVGVEVVGGFVEGEQARRAPEGDGDLQALAFAVGKGFPARVPVVADG